MPKSILFYLICLSCLLAPACGYSNSSSLVDPPPVEQELKPQRAKQKRLKRKRSKQPKRSRKEIAKNVDLFISILGVLLLVGGFIVFILGFGATGTELMKILGTIGVALGPLFVALGFFLPGTGINTGGFIPLATIAFLIIAGIITFARGLAIASPFMWILGLLMWGLPILTVLILFIILSLAG